MIYCGNGKHDNTINPFTNVFDRRGRQAGVTNGAAITLVTLNDAGETLLETNLTGVLAGLSVTNAFDQFLRRTNLSLLSSISHLLTSTADSFDAASRLSAVSESTNSTTYSYLANSPLVSQITFKSNSVTRMTTTKQYDYLNRLLSVSSAPSAASALTFNYSYNSANQRIQVNLADGSFWIYLYDSLGQVISGKKYWPDWTPVAGQQFQYAFDDIGNRSQAQAGGDQNGSNLRSANYSANTLNQYTSRDVPAFADIMGESFATSSVTVNALAAYRHGEYFRQQLPVDNSSAAQWTNITVAATGQASATGHVFVAQTPEIFRYDADGNLTNDGRWTYAWDAENRLTNMISLATAPSGSKLKLDFLYD